MAKNIFLDEVWPILHFNSSLEAYHAGRHIPAQLECCYCHEKISVRLPKKVGTTQIEGCKSCNNVNEYRTLLLPDQLTKAFNVRDGANNHFALTFGCIMHVLLPINHPDFDALITSLTEDNLDYFPKYRSNLPRFLLISEILNKVRIIYSARVKDLFHRSFKSGYSFAHIATTFLNLGDTVFPVTSDITTDFFPPPQLVDFLSIELDDFLLEQYGKDLTDDKCKWISSSLLQISYYHISEILKKFPLAESSNI